MESPVLKPSSPAKKTQLQMEMESLVLKPSSPAKKTRLQILTESPAQKSTSKKTGVTEEEFSSKAFNSK
jgi:hypothetical protein